MAPHSTSNGDGAPTIAAWSASAPDALETLRQILRLAKANSGTLGFLPNKAFTERARFHGLIYAERNGAVAGYVLFDLPRAGYIKLIHVCVSEQERGGRLAQSMIALATSHNPRATGIYAACRDDYGMDSFWTSLGLSPEWAKPGRALKGSTLVKWWRPLGQLDLFESLLATASAPLAVLDSNVVADLFGSETPHRPTRVESEALLSSWVADGVTFALSPQVNVEINRHPDPEERARRRENSAHIPRLRSQRSDDPRIERALLEHIGPTSIAADSSLRDDCKHLADAITNNAKYFVTHDATFTRRIGSWVQEHYGVQVLKPYQLVQQLASPVDIRFRSRLIESSSYKWSDAHVAVLDDLASRFITAGAGERTREWTQRLREFLARPAQFSTDLLLGPKDSPVALIVSERTADELVVHLVRVQAGTTTQTVARQLTRWLRDQATARHASRIAVIDGAANRVMADALIDDGFTPRASQLVATCISGAHEIRELLPRGAEPTVDEALLVERQHWPMIALDIAIPTFILPIQPRFADALFAYRDPGLLEMRKPSLGLSREHVYYHADGTTQIPAGPARLLWYVSEDKTHSERRVIALSTTIESRTLPAATAHDLFAHLGTLRRRHVLEVANRKGNVHVIRFQDTHLLPRPLPRTQLRELLDHYGVKGNLQSLRQVPPASFSALVRASTDESER